MTSKVLDDYPKYIVYDDGRIEATSTKKCILRPAINQDGYHVVNLISTKSKNGYRQIIGLHRIVAQAFVPNHDNLPEVNHKDGNKLNNHYSNLEWCDRSGNLKHAYALGLRNSEGSMLACSKLKEWQIKAIKWLYKTGFYTQKELGNIYKVTQTQVGYIVNGKSWANL